MLLSGPLLDQQFHTRAREQTIYASFLSSRYRPRGAHIHTYESKRTKSSELFRFEEESLCAFAGSDSTISKMTPESKGINANPRRETQRLIHHGVVLSIRPTLSGHVCGNGSTLDTCLSSLSFSCPNGQFDSIIFWNASWSPDSIGDACCKDFQGTMVRC